MKIDQLFTNNQEWIDAKLKQDPDFLKKLSSDQKPTILYIGCSDSRVTAEELMGAEPGEVFVHRNIANMVPNTDLSAMSVINYAINTLQVKHIVICGHYDCGGVKAAMDSSDLGILNPWLRNIRDVYRLHNEELKSIADQADRYKRLVELNIQEQCINVIKTSEYQKAYKERKVSVHGLVFDLKTGKLTDLKINFNKILEKIMEIYTLK